MTTPNNPPIPGKKIILIEMVDDPNPVPPGIWGTITHYGGGVINVDWENGRTIGVVEGIDKYGIEK